MNDEITSKIEQLIEYVNILKGYQHFKRKTETTGVLPEGIFDPWEQGILPENSAIQFAPSAGFRNRLVHMYAKIDIVKLHYYLQNNIGDIEQFSKYIAQYLIKRR